jgi:hypothetical protein
LGTFRLSDSSYVLHSTREIKPCLPEMGVAAGAKGPSCTPVWVGGSADDPYCPVSRAHRESILEATSIDWLRHDRHTHHLGRSPEPTDRCRKLRPQRPHFINESPSSSATASSLCRSGASATGRRSEGIRGTTLLRSVAQKRRQACTGRQPDTVVLPKQGVTPKRGQFPAYTQASLCNQPFVLRTRGLCRGSFASTGLG